MQARQIPVLIGLLLAAAVSSWLVWLLREPAPAPALVGPPRSDYFLTDFSMVALDAEGRESFAAQGPRLARHPTAGTLEVSAPEFTLPDAEGGRWLARADAAWVSADAGELRLLRAVRVTAPEGAEGPSELQTERLDLFPRMRQLRSADAVTASGPGFILRGVGLEAELETRRFRLLDQVSARYEPPSR
jgi:lipopolysaccharide export system protein LptC